ncbi:hypothetical protein BC829DRAFT_365804, partial [Chytridium lagenaria]
PQEISAKKAVSRKRTVVEASQHKGRDPRFEAPNGNVNVGLFKESYKFLDEYRKNEIGMIDQVLKKEKNPEEREKLIKLHQSMTTALKANQTEDKRKKVIKEWKKTEAEAVKSGKKPYFLKKGDVKKMMLIEKYKKMTPAQVEKLMEKRRKDNASSEKRFLPYARR